MEASIHIEGPECLNDPLSAIMPKFHQLVLPCDLETDYLVGDCKICIVDVELQFLAELQRE